MMLSKRGVRERRRLPLLLIPFLMLFVAAWRSSTANVLADAGWWNPDWSYRVPVTVGANGYERVDKPVEVPINVTQLLVAQGQSGSLIVDSIRVIEVDASGAVVSAMVPQQFDPAPDFNAASNASGTLIFIMTGTTAAASTRHYHVYFDTSGSFTPPVVAPQVVFTGNVMDEGFSSYRIETQSADYYYHKSGGGFSSLDDSGGNDWIQWTADPKYAGDYRGIPNLVNPKDGGYFHPGRTTAVTTLVSAGPLKASFKSSAGSGQWETLWEIFPTYARLTVLKKPSAKNYWFLYEGTPGGTLEATDKVVLSNGAQKAATFVPSTGEVWPGDISGEEWVYFTDAGLGRSLFLSQHVENNFVDTYAASPDRLMTIWGFGRNGLQRYLNQAPARFTIGLVDETEVGPVGTAVHDAYQPLAITLNGEAIDTDEPEDNGPICAGGTLEVLLSTKADGKLASLVSGPAFGAEDVLKYSAADCSWTKAFDGTDAKLPASANIDAFEFAGDDLYLSFLAPVSIPAAVSATGATLKADDSDIVLYSGGKFNLWLDGSLPAIGLTTNAEDIDAIGFDENGDVLVSTLGAAALPGLGQIRDEDIVRYKDGAWEFVFDGSGVTGMAVENLAGLSRSSTGDLHLSFINGYKLTGENGAVVSGDAKSVTTCTPTGLGLNSTDCNLVFLWNTAGFTLPPIAAIDIN